MRALSHTIVLSAECDRVCKEHSIVMSHSKQSLNGGDDDYSWSGNVTSFSLLNFNSASLCYQLHSV